MPKYSIHFYDEIRIEVRHIEADSILEAIDKAEKRFPHYSEFNHEGDGWNAELTGDRMAYLIDPLDDNGEVCYEDSFIYDAEGHSHQSEKAIELLSKVSMRLSDEKLLNEILDFLKSVESDKVQNHPHPLIEKNKNYNLYCNHKRELNETPLPFDDWLQFEIDAIDEWNIT